MSEYKLPKDGLELLSARFQHRVIVDWREEFDLFERDFLFYLLAITVARNNPTIKLSRKELFTTIPPGKNPQHWKGLPRLCDPEDKAEMRIYLTVLRNLAKRGVVKVYRAGGPAATRRHLLVNLAWTPERVHA